MRSQRTYLFLEYFDDKIFCCSTMNSFWSDFTDVFVTTKSLYEGGHWYSNIMRDSRLAHCRFPFMNWRLTFFWVVDRNIQDMLSEDSVVWLVLREFLGSSVWSNRTIRSMKFSRWQLHWECKNQEYLWADEVVSVMLMDHLLGVLADSGHSLNSRVREIAVRSFTREHDAVCSIDDSICDVCHLSTCWSGVFNHRLQHLCGAENPTQTYRMTQLTNRNQ